MAWTYAELSKIETDILRKSVIDTLLMETNSLELVPWETIGQLSTGFIAVQDLPSVGFRKINAGYTESTGHLKQKVEHVSLLGGDIDTDIAYARAKNTIADARALMQQLMLKAMAYKFNDCLINGNPEVTPEEFKGLRQRVDDVVAEGYTGQKVDCACAGKGILNDSAARHAFLDKLDTLIYAMKGHKPAYIFMNSKLLLAIRSLLRQEKLLDTTKDMFDRVIDVYMGARLVDVGVKADQTTEIITSTETSAGLDGSDEHTSLYAVTFGEGDMTWGIQEYPLEARDLGELETLPVFRTRVDFPCGLATVEPRSIGRMYGIIPDASS